MIVAPETQPSSAAPARPAIYMAKLFHFPSKLEKWVVSSYYSYFTDGETEAQRWGREKEVG